MSLLIHRHTQHNRVKSSSSVETYPTALLGRTVKGVIEESVA